MTDYYESGLGPPDATELRLRGEITDQILAVVQALLDNPEAVAILKRVELYGDFTETEEQFLTTCSRAWERLTTWNVAGPHNYPASDYWSIAQALARRVVAGLFNSLASDDVRAYVFERTYAVGRPEDWHPGSQASYSTRQRDFKISFDEFYAVLKEFAAWDQIPVIVARARKKASLADDSITSTRIFSHFASSLITHEKKIFRKHGLINDRMSVQSIEISSRMNGLALDDREAVRALAAKVNLAFIKGIRS